MFEKKTQLDGLYKV